MSERPTCTVAVMGAGAWGSAMAQVLAEAGNAVTLWARRPEIADEINIDHRNLRYTGRAHLPTDVRATSDPAKALAGRARCLWCPPNARCPEVDR